MDIKTLEEKLIVLDEEIQNILKELGYAKKFEIPNLEFDKDDLEECMMYKELCSIFSHFDYIHSMLDNLPKLV